MKRESTDSVRDGGSVEVEAVAVKRSTSSCVVVVTRELRARAGEDEDARHGRNHVGANADALGAFSQRRVFKTHARARARHQHTRQEHLHES